jgi:hypothetical protein
MYKKQLMFFTSLLVLFSAFFFGCNQDKFDAGIDLVPDSLRINSSATDTFSVEAYTHKVDSIQTSNTSKVLVGRYNDPILGEINAAFVTELIPEDVNVSMLTADTTVIDDLVLYLRYPLSGLRFYGDSMQSIRIDVMKINKYLSYSDTIYSNFEPHILNASSSPIASYIFRPDTIIENAEEEADQKYQDLLADTVGGKVPDTANIVRPDPVHVVAIKLPDEWKNDIKDLLYNSINGTTTFAQEFNGLYIKANSVPTPYSISIFDYTNSETKVSLHYHYDSDTTDFGRSYDFNLSSANTRFNLFDHNYLPNIESVNDVQNEVVYVHGIGGLKAKVEFPSLDKIIEEGLFAVNRAELIFKVENVNDEDSYYPFPNNLMLKRIVDEDEEENAGYLDEYINQSSNTYSGASYENGQYKFDITLYMQRVFKGDYDNNGLFLSIPDEAINPSRVVLTSGNHSNRIKLKLTLTKTN